jgi:hypothetical protein
MTDDELTATEHSDLRDLVIAGAQRIRPARRARTVASVAVAVVLIAGLTGGAIGIGMSLSQRGRIASSPTPAATALVPEFEASPTPSDRMPADLEAAVGGSVQAASVRYVGVAGGLSVYIAHGTDAETRYCILITGDGQEPMAGCAPGLPVQASTPGDRVVVTFGGAGATLATGFRSLSPSVSYSASDAGAAPAACTQYPQPIQSDDAAYGAELQAAARSARLPESAVLGPTFQVTRSSDHPGRFAAVIAVCSAGFTRETLISVATTIAAAIAADPAHTKLVSLEVVPWRTIDSSAISADPVIQPVTTDFAAHDWTGSASSLHSAWR